MKTQVTLLGGSLGAMWATLGANVLAGGALNNWGVVPRTRDGLWGILFAPFLHGSVQHLVANSIGFAILGSLVMLRRTRLFFPVTLFAMLGSGLFAWTFGPSNSDHIGASGVIFGYLGYLMTAGLFARSWGSILLSVVVTALWGGMVFGALPNQPGVSWQMHLGGFIGGILAARFLRRVP